MYLNTILSVKNLVKVFKEKNYFKTIINNISFDLKSGEILGLIGKNGSGKSTIIQMLLSVLTPTSGSIEYFKKDLFQYRSEILKDVNFVSNYVKLPDKLTVKENLNIYLEIYNKNNKNNKNYIKNYLDAFNLYKYIDSKIEILSSGENLKLMIIKALITNPKILLLDEPTSQIDPESAQQIREFILTKQKENNLSIILTSHNIQEINYMCNRVICIKNGQIDYAN